MVRFANWHHQLHLESVWMELLYAMLRKEASVHLKFLLSTVLTANPSFSFHQNSNSDLAPSASRFRLTSRIIFRRISIAKRSLYPEQHESRSQHGNMALMQYWRTSRDTNKKESFLSTSCVHTDVRAQSNDLPQLHTSQQSRHRSWTFPLEGVSWTSPPSSPLFPANLPWSTSFEFTCPCLALLNPLNLWIVTQHPHGKCTFLLIFRTLIPLSSAHSLHIYACRKKYTRCLTLVAAASSFCSVSSFSRAFAALDLTAMTGLTDRWNCRGEQGSGAQCRVSKHTLSKSQQFTVGPHWFTTLCSS